MSVILLTMIAMILSAALGAALVSYRRSLPDAATLPDPLVLPGPVFLFCGDDLIDATPEAQQMIAPLSDLPDRDAMLQILGPDFPALAEKISAKDQIFRRIMHKSKADVWIDLDWPKGQMRLVMRGALHDACADAEQQGELGLLRDITRHAPHLMWRTDTKNNIVWANAAYLAFWDNLHAQNDVELAEKILFPALSTCAPGYRRIALALPNQQAQHWFDVASISKTNAVLHYAIDANNAVRADQDRQNFVQTLGKTFAELSIGLAIFDKRRQLATFNPALLDMTRLEFEFLSARPTIDTVLDRLRETRILPEPKDYGSWRDQFTAVETAAKNGTYSAVWNLPDGQAFRVTGRPHPDGAFAFLFEDITADLSLTRRFRSDIETGQAVLDALPDAVAVFSTAGTLVMYNRAYMLLWGMQADAGLEHRGLGAERAIWQARCLDDHAWADLDQFLHQTGPRKPWTDDALLADGRLVRCHAGQIAGGMMMVRFTLGPAGLPALRKLTQVDPAILAARR